MSNSDTNHNNITLTVNGQKITAPPNNTVIQALWYSGDARIKGVGCVEGVCGSCRALVRHDHNATVTTELACQTTIKDGMDVIFPPLSRPAQRRYQLSNIKNTNDTQPQFNRIFPEANHCRHCGGCNVACPKDIDVEQGVNLAAKGQFNKAGELFMKCVMCDLCSHACPELISPNYVGLFARRVSTYFHMQPPNLISRLAQLNSPLKHEKNKMNIVIPDKAHDH